MFSMFGIFTLTCLSLLITAVTLSSYWLLVYFFSGHMALTI